MHNLNFLWIFGLALLGACQTSTQTLPKVLEATLRAHVRTLASDEFEGRKPFTSGEEKTVNYLKTQFQQLGLEPGNGRGFFQQVPLVELDAQPAEVLALTGEKNGTTLYLGKDYVAYSARVNAMNTLRNSEVVFAGYGIVAPEYGWDDYKGLDVKGKTVIVLVNDPGFGSADSTLFKGETMTYYGRWTYKYEEAARQGAAGCFIIHQTVPAGYGWEVVRNSWSGASLYLDPQDNYRCAVQGWLTRDAAIQMFETSAVDMKNFVKKARDRNFKPISLGLGATTFVKNGIKRDKSKNVVAKITGSEKPEEYIIYSAHWDHLGIGPAVDGDSTYNGAHDNASGVAALLGIAEAFKKGQAPKRSVIFLAVTAEEQGLLGSQYYAENLIYPVNKTVANLNMDGLKEFGATNDLTVVGYGQSDLEEMAEEVAKKQDRYIIADPEPEKGFYFRSDHFQFAKVGIPALYAYGAYEHRLQGVEYMTEKKNEYNVQAYHRPADEWGDDWDFGGIMQDAQLYFEIGYQLANSDRWPQWKEGSEFKTIRQLNTRDTSQ